MRPPPAKSPGVCALGIYEERASSNASFQAPSGSGLQARPSSPRSQEPGPSARDHYDAERMGEAHSWICRRYWSVRRLRVSDASHIREQDRRHGHQALHWGHQTVEGAQTLTERQPRGKYTHILFIENEKGTSGIEASSQPA